MDYTGRMVNARFVARRKRFLCDVVTEDGEALTAHIANTGAMTGCSEPGAPVRLRDSADPKRKLRFSVEQICVAGEWIVVNTARANQVVAEALTSGALRGTFGVGPVRREVWHGASRIDFGVGEPLHTLVEVKSVTLKVGELLAFPDAVTERGRKHVDALGDLAADGFGAALVFLVSRQGGRQVGVARHVDPAYAESLELAVSKGLRVEAWRAMPRRDGIDFGERLPLGL